MERRGFFNSLLGLVDPAAPLAKTNAFANTALPKRAAETAAGLEPYAGPWGFEEAAHLLRRTLFGVRQEEVERAVSMGMKATVETLLGPGNAQVAPTHEYDHDVIKIFWMKNMARDDFSIQEKMTLFWHNHFVIEADQMPYTRITSTYYDLLRKHHMGNLRDFTKAITVHPSMLRYLNGDNSYKASPNDNYARELQELFTIGKGPQVEPGDYTHYTEQDIKEAARVLTGWQHNADWTTSSFLANHHDTGDKVFSKAYGNRIIRGRTGADGALETDELLDMIFAQHETARYICRRLHIWFVYYVIDGTIEQSIIEPMAAVLRGSGWDIRAAMAALLQSAYFYDRGNRGCVIKTPLDLMLGSLRVFRAAPATDKDLAWECLLELSADMQMDPLNPPNVAGWNAFHQAPVYYQAWISSATLPLRHRFSDAVSGGGEFRLRGLPYRFPIDAVTFALKLPKASDPDQLVADSVKVLFPVPISAEQATFLKESLLRGGPGYAWTGEWNRFIADPKDAGARQVVAGRLENLFKTMMRLAEYQLC